MSGGIGTGQSVLVVDDEPTIQELLQIVLEEDDFRVESAGTLEDAMAKLVTGSFDVVIVDKNLPDGNGLEIARYARDHEMTCEVVVITAFVNLDSAIEAMKLGVAEYIPKPFSDIDVVRSCMRRVVRTRQLKVEKAQLIDELVAKTRMLEAMAVRDPITGLYTHTYMHDVIEREVARCERLGEEVAVMLVDVDQFHEVNDQHGHETGNQLMTELSNAVLRWLRKEEIAARFGGDELAIVMPDTSKGAAATRAEELRARVEELEFPVLGVGRQTVSVGVAAYPRDARDRVGLLKSAQTALYAAKHSGRNRIASYTRQLDSVRVKDGERAESDLRTLRALERSIAGADFDFVYQPIVYADDVDRAFAFEALCRPRAPEFPNPLALIHAAERAGRIAPLGRALRQGGIRALAQMPADSVMFLNLHPLELHDREFNTIESFLAEWSGQVVFEITEVAGIKDYAPVKEIIRQMRGAGFRIALDDLGSGYSGLNSLAMLQPDFVKLDMDLVHSITGDARARRLVRHIVEFATEEGMLVVGEGVETAEQRAVLTEMGCQLLQGFLFSRGVPINDVLERWF